MEQNKKGYTTISLIAVIFLGLAILIILGISTYGFNLVDESFSSIDFEVGNLSWQENYNQTLKKGIDPMRTSVPQIISIGTLLGMIMSLMFVSYSVKKIGRMWILLDIIFIIIAEIVAATIRVNFLAYINSSPELLQIYSTTLSEGSRFILNMPIIIPAIGMLVMLVTYIITGKNKEEDQSF